MTYNGRPINDTNDVPSFWFGAEGSTFTEIAPPQTITFNSKAVIDGFTVQPKKGGSTHYGGNGGNSGEPIPWADQITVLEIRTRLWNGENTISYMKLIINNKQHEIGDTKFPGDCAFHSEHGFLASLIGVYSKSTYINALSFSIDQQGTFPIWVGRTGSTPTQIAWPDDHGLPATVTFNWGGDLINGFTVQGKDDRYPTPYGGNGGKTKGQLAYDPDSSTFKLNTIGMRNSNGNIAISYLKIPSGEYGNPPAQGDVVFHIDARESYWEGFYSVKDGDGTQYIDALSFNQVP